MIPFHSCEKILATFLPDLESWTETDRQILDANEGVITLQLVGCVVVLETFLPGSESWSEIVEQILGASEDSSNVPVPGCEVVPVASHSDPDCVDTENETVSSILGEEPDPDFEPELTVVDFEPELTVVDFEPELTVVDFEPELTVVDFGPELTVTDFGIGFDCKPVVLALGLKSTGLFHLVAGSSSGTF